MYAEYITRQFVELGHDVSVFTLNSIGIKTREIMKGVEVHRPMITDASNVFPLFVEEDLRRWGTHIKFFSDIFVYNVLSATKFVNELVRKEEYKYDIICVHDWLSSIAGLIIKSELKLPLVFHAHSTEWGRSGDGGSRIITHLEDAIAQASDRNITVSYLMKEDLARHGWDERKIHVVWNGVNSGRYNPKNVDQETPQKLREKYNIKEDEHMILFVGRLAWVKGIKNLIQALPLILNEFPKTKLVILGRGEEQKEIVELTERLKLNDKVIRRFEFVPEEERITHYSASDVCAFPSVYEPFGIVSLEAMAMEKPVVVGARGIVGFREQVIPSGPAQNGIHVNGGHPPDIAWGIKEVLRDRERAKKWGKNGRNRVLKYFTWKYAAEQTIKIYESLIS
ncbi:MAG: glycosyltransferase family 4 protein [Candidatus Methylarchaceae archaeon HK02M1]|nr:glycosyltransferase family 4 protein [Candidatus Methylarchaceae archaeon HK02M1]